MSWDSVLAISVSLALAAIASLKRQKDDVEKKLAETAKKVKALEARCAQLSDDNRMLGKEADTLKGSMEVLKSQGKL